MTEPLNNPHPSSADGGPNDGAADPEKAPRWVKVFGIVAAVLVAAFLAVHIAGGGLGHHGM